MIKKEEELYNDIVFWFTNYLQNKFKNCYIICNDTSKQYLSDFLSRNNIKKFFPIGDTYKIKIDITGVVIKNEKIKLFLIEVKKNKINLMDVSQIIGYTRITKPEEAFLISPKGWSSSINKLIKLYQRDDILEYDTNKKIKIARWDINSKSIKSGDYL